MNIYFDYIPMNATDIFNYARLKSYVDVLQYSDSTLLPFLNIRYHELENLITTLKEDYFYDVYTSDTVAWQNRYIMKSSTATAEWVKKVISTAIKYWATDQFFYKLNLWNTDNDSRSLDKISSETSKENGFYVMKWTEIIVYPTPSESVTWWLVQEVIVNLKDLTATSVEADIFSTTIDNHSELRQYHYILWLWIASDVFGLRWMYWEKAQLDNEYNIAKENMIRQISDRYQSPIVQQLLDVNYYK